MPPVNQQGSRAGLITALVIFVLLFFVAGSFAVYYYIELDKGRAERKASNDLIAKVLPDDSTRDPFLSLYSSEKNDPIVKVLQERVKIISGMISGKSVSSDPAQDPVEPVKKAKEDAIRAANDRVTGAGVTLNAGSPMTDAVSALATKVAAQHTDLIKRGNDAKYDADQYAKAIADLTQKLKDKENEITAANAKVDVERQKAEGMRNTEQKKVEDVTVNVSKQVTEAQKKADDTLVMLQQKQTELATALEQIKKLKDRLAFLRLDTRAAQLREADGFIVRVAGGSTAFINLGYGDQISPGLTFEVYDAKEGVPNVLSQGATEEQLPNGKASIEVVNVGQNQSEVRVIRVSPGASIASNDVIANLIYNRHVKFRFCIYPGDGFDLNQDGRVNPTDTEVLKKLVNKWGGMAQDDINIDTDFLILGKEPVIPKGDPNNPEDKQKIDVAKERLDKYDKKRQMALDLHIPILNQNRFLYYIGYFDMARKGP